MTPYFALGRPSSEGQRYRYQEVFADRHWGSLACSSSLRSLDSRFLCFRPQRPFCSRSFPPFFLELLQFTSWWLRCDSRGATFVPHAWHLRVTFSAYGSSSFWLLASKQNLNWCPEWSLLRWLLPLCRYHQVAWRRSHHETVRAGGANLPNPHHLAGKMIHDRV